MEKLARGEHKNPKIYNMSNSILINFFEYRDINVYEEIVDLEIPVNGFMFS